LTESKSFSTDVYLCTNSQALNIELKASLAEAEESIKLKEKILNEKTGILETLQSELSLVKKANDEMVSI
jgi:hypothetical protein